MRRISHRGGYGQRTCCAALGSLTLRKPDAPSAAPHLDKIAFSPQRAGLVWLRASESTRSLQYLREDLCWLRNLSRPGSGVTLVTKGLAVLQLTVIGSRTFQPKTSSSKPLEIATSYTCQTSIHRRTAPAKRAGCLCATTPGRLHTSPVRT